MEYKPSRSEISKLSTHILRKERHYFIKHRDHLDTCHLCKQHKGNGWRDAGYDDDCISGLETYNRWVQLGDALQVVVQLGVRGRRQAPPLYP